MRWMLSLLLLGVIGATCLPTPQQPKYHTVQLTSKPIVIRLLALKHCKEAMADSDANLAIKAVEKAAAKGLNIKVIGNHHINRNGQSMLVCQYDNYELPQLQEFISKQMSASAVSGDTLIVFTIGHGGAQGDLQSIGQRAELMQAIVGAAEANKQRTLWWQLSCYASAKLPDIKSLTPAQQKLFSILASSDAQHESLSGEQGKIMEKVFLALAEKSNAIDPNGDNVITAAELKNFLGKRGDYLYTSSPDYVIFGQRRIILPIVDRNNPQGHYDEEYVPFPD